MKEIFIESWNEFIDALKELEICRDSFTAKAFSRVPNFLYRGQSNSDYKLTTTLERYLDKEVSLTEYYKLAYAAKSRVETFTKKTWDIPSPSEFEVWVTNQTQIHFMNMPGYEYFAYLRHHGYPSPLFDWTESPYVALFFANRFAGKRVKYCSVFVFLENTGRGKIGSNDEPYIKILGPYAKIHKRHLLQRSNYTICTLAKDKNYFFTNHEKAVGDATSAQDIIWKLNINNVLQPLILKELCKMNIEAFSLFETEDSLMESIAIAEKYFR